MLPKTKKINLELSFYKKAYSDNKNRRNKKFSWEHTPSETIIKMLDKNRIKGFGHLRALDLGCGDGRHIELLRKNGFEVWGVDFCNEAINLCKKRFKQNKKVHLKRLNLTTKNSLKNIGYFDLILDWSVLDHIRKRYRKTYLNNIQKTLKDNGYIVFSEFNENLPGLFRNKDYKTINGHYSKTYSIKELKNIFPKMKLIDYKTSTLEDKINNYRFNTVLLRKINK